MARGEFDGKDVLDRYIALIKRTGGQGPQDIARLPAPKDVIKDVLLDVLRKASPDMDATPVKQAFMLLATFQDLPNLTSGSVDNWPDGMTETADPGMDSTSPHKAAHEKVSSLTNQNDPNAEPSMITAASAISAPTMATMKTLK